MEDEDEGVEMEGELFDSQKTQSDSVITTDSPKLYISPDLKHNMKEHLPQIMVPRYVIIYV